MTVRHSDLRGAARLATDATAGLADLVEAMHDRVTRIPGVWPRTPPGRTGGLTGLVYKSIRGATRLAGGSIDALLALLEPELAADESVLEREALLAALNGVLGDYLFESGNPLAIPMSVRCDGRALPEDAQSLAQRLPRAGARLLVMIHGLCMSDLQWSRGGHDHGRALASDLGCTAVYAHYNSGLHVSINGRRLAQRLESLVAHWPCALESITIVGHSMGGLVARSALHDAAQAGHRWPTLVSDLVFLGTPHHGAPLERAGQSLHLLLEATPYVSPFARLGKLRSAGITDLRYGHLLDEDWVGRDRFARTPDKRRHLPLPETIRCYALAATTGREQGDARDRVLGDGLVPLASALGEHPDPQRCLAFAPQRRGLAYETNHLGLLERPKVYDRLAGWLATEASTRRVRRPSARRS